MSHTMHRPRHKGIYARITASSKAFAHCGVTFYASGANLDIEERTEQMRACIVSHGWGLGKRHPVGRLKSSRLILLRAETARRNEEVEL